MAKPSSEILAAVRLIQEACARNTPVDVQYVDQRQQLHTARCRMLVASADELFLDEPHSIGTETSLHAGTPITAYFALGETRYAIETVVTRRGVSIMLNQKKRVAGIVVSMPPRVTESQRRNDFRVSLLHRAPIVAHVHEASPSEGTAPIDATEIVGSAVNMSAGGAAIVVPIDAGRGLSIGTEVYLSFVVDDDEDAEPYLFRAQIRQARPIADDTAVRIGLQFLPWPDHRAMRRTQDRLRRFLSRAERERLKRAG